MADTNNKTERPLSPHLQVYRWPLGMAMSISHRASGVALIFGMFLVVAMLITAALGEEYYMPLEEFLTSIIGKLMIFGWSVALFYHMSNGVRHLLWDMGFLFKKDNAFKSGLVVLLSTIVLTAAVWLLV